MSGSTDIDRLNRRLSQHSLGPVGPMASEAASSALATGRSIAGLLRQYAFDRPWITLLLAFQAGYLLARMGRRHART
jgi:hypothetical protein